MNFKTALTAIFVALIALTCTAGATEIVYDFSGIPDSPSAGTQYIVPVTVSGDVTGYKLTVLYDTDAAEIDFSFDENGSIPTLGGRPGAKKIVSADGAPKTFDLLITPLKNATITLKGELAGDIPCITHDEIKFVFGVKPTAAPSPVVEPTPTAKPTPVVDPTPTAEPTTTPEPTINPVSGTVDLTPTNGMIDWGAESIEIVDGAVSIPVIMTGADRVEGITVALKNVSGADVALNKTGSAVFRSGSATRLNWYSASAFTNSGTVLLYTIDISGISEGTIVSFDLEYKIRAAGRDATLDYTESNPVSVGFAVSNADDTFTVTLPSADEQIGYTIAAADGSSSPVGCGGSYAFTFALDEAYSNSPVVIKINGEELVMTGNEYTIENITEDVVVTVEGVTINTYNVTLPSVEEQIGYTIKAANGSSSPVADGGNYTFAFALDEACSDSSVVIKINGRRLVRPGSQYTIRNVTGDVVVTVDNVTVNTYTVTLPSAEEQIGYTIAAVNGSSSPVKYSGNYTFTFAAEDGYSCVIKVNGEELVMTGDQYTIENITVNTSVTVEATAEPPSAFTVDYRGADYVPSSDIVNAGEKYVVSEDRGISPGKIFRCWISDSDGREYYAGDELTVSGNVILTADWYTPAVRPTGANVVDLYKALHGEDPDQYLDYDMNGDGYVNIIDLVLMAQYVADSVAVIPEDRITWDTSAVVFDNGSASIPVIMTDAYRIQGMRVSVKNVSNANVTLNGTGSPIFRESGSVIVYFTPDSGYTNEGAAHIFSVDITDAAIGSDVMFTLDFEMTSNGKDVTSSYVTTPAGVKISVRDMN